MYDIARFHTEYAGMAARPTHEAEINQQLEAEKSEHADSRSGYRCGYRPRHLDTPMYLMAPKQGAAGRLHSVLRHGRSSADPSNTGSLYSGYFHPQDGQSGQKSGRRDPVPQSG